MLLQTSCHCGFVIDAGMVGQAKIVCPNCSRAMCQLCKKVVSAMSVFSFSLLVTEYQYCYTDKMLY